MRLIINTSNLYGGGGVQVALSFINECVHFTEHEYHVFLCPRVSRQIDIRVFPLNFHFYHFQHLASLSILGFRVIKQLALLEKQIQPDCVFSVFGPSYWTPKSVHLMGFANGHFLYPESVFFKKIPLKQNLRWKLLSFAKRLFFLINSKYYHVETEDARKRLATYLAISTDSIFLVSNTYNSIFNSAISNQAKILPQKKDSEFRFLCITAYYPHKNLEILNSVIPLLIERGFPQVRFVLTIDQESFESVFSKVAQQQIVNIGAVSIVDCPQLYSECDAVLSPTLLEIFSANYPEAMKMEKPILTSDLSFARTVCEDAALYFDPVNPVDIVDSIVRLLTDSSIQLELITKGSERLKTFNTANERAAKYLNICERISCHQ